MAKLYFSLNKDQDGTLCDLIFFSKNKTTAKNELRDKGYTPKIVLTWDDIEKLESNILQNNDITEEYRDFVLSHMKEWEKTMNQLEEN